jgi:hypothetical protein
MPAPALFNLAIIMKATIHSLPGLTEKEMINIASQAEKNNDEERAVELYEQAIKKKPLDEVPHKRLMIIYRKNKNIKEEMKAIDRAIKIWRDHSRSLQDDMHVDHPARAKIKRLSLSIEKKLAAQHIEPEPIAGWLKRKQLIQKKMKSRKK